MYFVSIRLTQALVIWFTAGMLDEVRIIVRRRRFMELLGGT